MLPSNSPMVQMAGMRPDLPAPSATAASRPALRKLREWMGRQVATAKKAAAFPSAPRIDDPSSTWYAGMVIDPTDFSEQLCRLQISLMHAGQPVGEKAPVTEKVQGS